MIVFCPTCLRKYEVSNTAIGEGRMVRCVVCGTTWQQDAVSVPSQKNRRVDIKKSLIWTLSICFWLGGGWFLAFGSPYCSNFMKNIECISRIGQENDCKFLVKNMSHSFLKKDDGYYVQISGMIENLSPVALDKLNLVFNLRTYPDKQQLETALDENAFFNETWVEKIKPEWIRDNKLVTFSYTLKKIPNCDILCTIKLDNKI